MSSIAGSITPSLAPTTIEDFPFFKKSDFSLRFNWFVENISKKPSGGSIVDLHYVLDDKKSWFKKLFLDGFEEFTSYFGGQNVDDYSIFEVDNSNLRMRIFQDGNGTLVVIGFVNSSKVKRSYVVFPSHKVTSLPASIINLFDPKQILDNYGSAIYDRLFDPRGKDLDRIKRNKFVQIKKEETESVPSTPIQTTSPVDLSSFDPFKSVLDTSRQPLVGPSSKTVQQSGTKSGLDSLSEQYSKEFAKQQTIPESSQSPVKTPIFGSSAQKTEKGWLSNLVKPTPVQPPVIEEDDGYSTAREDDQPKIKKDDKGKGKARESVVDPVTQPVVDPVIGSEKIENKQKKTEKGSESFDEVLEKISNMNPSERIAYLKSLELKYEDLLKLSEKQNLRMKQLELELVSASDKSFSGPDNFFSGVGASAINFFLPSSYLEFERSKKKKAHLKIFEEINDLKRKSRLDSTSSEVPIATTSKVTTDQLPSTSKPVDDPVDPFKDRLSSLREEVGNYDQGYFDGLLQLPNTIGSFLKIFVVSLLVIVALCFLSFVMSFVNFLRDLSPSGRRGGR